MEQSAPLAPLPAVDEGAAPLADVLGVTMMLGVEEALIAARGVVVAIPVAKVVGTGWMAEALLEGIGAPEGTGAPDDTGAPEGAATPEDTLGAAGALLPGPSEGLAFTHCE